MATWWDTTRNLELNRGSWSAYDAGGIDAIQKLVEKYGDRAERTINDVLHGEGAEEIKNQIARLLPVSGREWRKKARPASVAMPRSFDQDNDVLAVTIVARGRYRYLYFPDDGSNTKHHAGQQHFMRRGAEAASQKIINICLGRLAKAWEE